MRTIWAGGTTGPERSRAARAAGEAAAPQPYRPAANWAALDPCQTGACIHNLGTIPGRVNE